MGISSISFTEIKAYADLMGLDFSAKEVMTLKNMSEAYVSESYNKNPNALSPFIDKEKLNQGNVDDSIRKAFEMF